tara:strand:+ start:748 stop:1140 length:393 start_codon:yes stop_codon:yes gene_type:complete
MRNNLIEVDLQSETHAVRFDSPIDSVRIDGKKLNDIHDLAVKVDGSSEYIATLAKRINTLAYIATFLAIMSVSLAVLVGGWLFFNADRIDESLADSKTMLEIQSTNGVLTQKLRSIGWVWKNGGWVQIEK